MSSKDSDPYFESPFQDHRDFPRLAVEAKARIQGVAFGKEIHAPAVISDLSLGGARLSTSVELQLDQELRLIPFSGIDSDHPLHKALVFTVVWQAASDGDDGSGGHDWDYYGLRHQGSVLDILESWVGHLLLRRKKNEDLIVQRRQYRRLRFPEETRQCITATVSHDGSHRDLTLIDIAPGGLLASGELPIPIGVHLEFPENLFSDAPTENDQHLSGCIIDCHDQHGSTFYRVSFDPESEVDEETLVDWATRLGGTFE